MEKVALVLQVKSWIESHPSEGKTTLAAAFSDKIVNFFDLGYIANDQNLDESQRKQKLEKYLGSIFYAYEHMAALTRVVGDETGGLADLEEVLRMTLRFLGSWIKQKSKRKELVAGIGFDNFKWLQNF